MYRSTYISNPDVQPQGYRHEDHHERRRKDAGEHCPAERTKVATVSMQGYVASGREGHQATKHTSRRDASTA